MDHPAGATEVSFSVAGAGGGGSKPVGGVVSR